MRSFGVELKEELSVSFSNPEWAEKYFVGEDAEFAQFMYENESLEELAGNVAFSFHRSFAWQNNVDVEGFATFVYQNEKKGYVSTTEECGSIIIQRSSGLEVDYVYEV